MDEFLSRNKQKAVFAWKTVMCMLCIYAIVARGGGRLFWFQLILTNTCQFLGVRPLLYKQLKSQNCLAGPLEQSIA